MTLLIQFLILVITLPMILFILEWYLCKKESKFAIFIPVIVACFFVLFGFQVLGISAIMLLIYVVMKCVLNEKRKSLSEIDKMNIQDLE